MQKLNALCQRGLRSFQGDAVFRRILSNSSWLLGANVISSICGLAQGILLARALGVEQYGTLGIITSFTAVMGQAFDSRSWETSIKFITQFWAQGDERRALAVIKLCYLVDIVTALVAFGLAWTLAGWAARAFLYDPAYTSSIRIYAFVLLCGWSGGTTALLRIFNRFDLLAKISAGMSALSLAGMVLVLFVWGLGLNGVLWVYVLLAVLSLGIDLYLAAYFLRSRFAVCWHEAQLGHLAGHRREIGRFLLSTNLTALLKIVQNNAPILALGYWSTPVQVGYYKLAQGFASNLGRVYGPIFQTIYPELSSLWAQRNVGQIRFVLRNLVIAVLPMGLTAVVVSAFWGAKLIQIIAGDEYLPAALPLVILVLVHAIVACTIWMGPLLLAAGKANKQTLAVAIGSAVMLTALALGTSRWGAIGASMAYLSFYVGWGGIGGVYVWQMLRERRE